jgi:signal transduction histidine kinase
LILFGLPSAALAGPLMLTEADLLLSDSPTPPPDDAPWQRVSLPDRERRVQPGQGGAAWYRMAFEVPASGAAAAPWAVYLPYFYDGAQLSLNGEPLARIRGSDAEVRVRWVRPHLLTVPEPLLQPGRNVLRVRATLPEGRALQFPAPAIGTHDELLPLYDRRLFWQRTLPQTAVVLSALMAAFILCVWWRRRQEVLYGLLGLAVLLWGIRTLPFVFEQVPTALWALWRAVFFAAQAGFAVVMALFALRFAGLRLHWLERGLWAYWAIGPVAMWAGGPNAEPWIDRVWGAGLIPIGLMVLLLVAWSAWRQRTWQACTLLAALGLVLVAGFHDYLMVSNVAWATRLAPVWLGHRIYLLQLAANVLLLVMAAILTSRFVQSLNTVEELNLTLERRVADREHQLANQFDAMAQLERDRAAEAERQRIMLDMHDGLGSQLFTSLSRVERGAMAQRDVAELLRDCIAEMRLALDALAPSDDDFRSALGNFRYRWDAQLDAAGVHASWSIDASDEGLQVPPHQRLELLRVLQEALTNVVKHAHARSVQVRVASRTQGLRFEVQDDGHGLDVARVRTGRGLHNMRARAHRLGAELSVVGTSPGTCVILQLGMPASTAQAARHAPDAAASLRSR